MLHFLALYALTLILEFALLSGLVPSGTTAHAACTALHLAATLCTACALLYAGTLGFQLWEDGSRASLYGLWALLTTLAGVACFTAYATFAEVAGLGPDRTGLLWVLYVVCVPACVGAYAALQAVLVWTRLGDQWALRGFYSLLWCPLLF